MLAADPSHVFLLCAHTAWLSFVSTHNSLYSHQLLLHMVRYEERREAAAAGLRGATSPPGGGCVLTAERTRLFSVEKCV